MFITNSSHLAKKNKKEGYIGYGVGKNFFFVLLIDKELSEEKGNQIIRKIEEDIQISELNNLSDLEFFISDEFKKNNLPTDTSMAIGYLKENILLLRTINKGEIFIKRGNNFAKLINRTQSASGYIQANDILIFTTESFSQSLPDEKKLNQLLNNNLTLTKENIEASIIDNQQDIIALFVASFEKRQPNNDIVRKKIQPPFFSEFKKTINNLQQLSRSSRKKTPAIIFIGIVAVILVWSVVLGTKRRQEAAITKRITVAKELIVQKLNQAEEISFLNMSRSLSLVNESKQELQKLRQGLSNGGKVQLSEIEKLIQDKENKITKKEEKNYEEFFDLAMDNKDIKGNGLYLDKDNLVILDDNKNSFYVLSLAKKSLDKQSFPEIKQVNLFASYAGDIFFYHPSNGIYKISDSKLKKVIDKDKDWGEIKGITIYNGNIYLADSFKNDIYKYLVVDDGYSSKKSYFGPGETVNLKDINSIAIDASVYLGFSDYVKKLTAGVRDDFNTDYPDKNISISKVITNKDLDKVYVWDKDKGSIYVLGKNGTYEKEIKASILKNANDVVVFENGIFILINSKIYKINID